VVTVIDEKFSKLPTVYAAERVLTRWIVESIIRNGETLSAGHPAEIKRIVQRSINWKDRRRGFCFCATRSRSEAARDSPVERLSFLVGLASNSR